MSSQLGLAGEPMFEEEIGEAFFAASICEKKSATVP